MGRISGGRCRLFVFRQPFQEQLGARAGLHEVLVLLVVRQGIELGIHVPGDPVQRLAADVAEGLPGPPGEVGTVLDEVLIELVEIVPCDPVECGQVGFLGHGSLGTHEDVCRGIGRVQTGHVHRRLLRIAFDREGGVIRGIGRVGVGLVQDVGHSTGFFDGLEQRIDSGENGFCHV